jgi:competence protein ComEA
MKLGLRRAAQLVRAALVRLLETTWWKPLLRVAFFACGLFALAFIGRSTSPASASPAAPVVSSIASSVASVSAPAAPISPPSIATATAAPAPTSMPSTSARATPENPVILNEASIDDLRRLPGIGPKRAEAVLALRSKIGRFHQVEDLLRVKGIGRATLKKLRPLVRLDPAPPPAGGDPAAAR